MVTSAPGSGRPPAPGAGRAQCSFQGSPQLPEAEVEAEVEAEGAAPAYRPAPAPWPWFCCGANAQLPPEITRAGGGNREGPRQTQAPAHLCPTRGGGGAGRAEKPQNSLELGKTGPSRAPLLSAAPGSSAGGPGRVRRRPAAHTGPGAGRCCLGEGASLTSSRAAISHAVRTLNLKGPCVPASEQAGFCF